MYCITRGPWAISLTLNTHEYFNSYSLSLILCVTRLLVFSVEYGLCGTSTIFNHRLYSPLCGPGMCAVLWDVYFLCEGRVCQTFNKGNPAVWPVSGPRLTCQLFGPFQGPDLPVSCLTRFRAPTNLSAVLICLLRTVMFLFDGNFRYFLH